MKRIYCTIFISLLLVASVTTFAPTYGLAVKESSVEAPASWFMGIKLNLTSELAKLGYTPENLPTIPCDVLANLIKSQKSFSPMNSNDYSNALVSGKVLHPAPPSYMSSLSANSESINNSEPVSTDYYGNKACLIVAIWDYPDPSYPDLTGYIDDAFYDLYDHVCADGGYDFITALTQEGATEWYVENWIDWLCMYYENVDVYFLGHGGGFEIWGWIYGTYLCWDVTWYGTGIIYPSFMYSWYDEVYQIFFDHSTLRMSIFSECWGGGFEDPCLDPGGFVNHDRAFVGGDGEIYADYTDLFIHAWGNFWYGLSYSSADAWYCSEQYAVNNSYYGTGQTRFDYADNGSSVWS